MNKRIKKKKRKIIKIYYKNYQILQSLYNNELTIFDLNTYSLVWNEKLKKRISKNKMIDLAIFYGAIIDDFNLLMEDKIYFDL